MEAMKIGMLGSGQVAKVLANGFLNHGHQVMMGILLDAELGMEI